MENLSLLSNEELFRLKEEYSIKSKLFSINEGALKVLL